MRPDDYLMGYTVDVVNVKRDRVILQKETEIMGVFPSVDINTFFALHNTRRS